MKPIEECKPKDHQYMYPPFWDGGDIIMLCGKCGYVKIVSIPDILLRQHSQKHRK